MISQLARRVYAPEFLVPPVHRRGELPDTKSAYSTALSTAWASIAETFLIALISMTDTVMVGAIGPHAIAAVGLVTQPRFIVLTLIIAMNMAVTSIAARRRGQNDTDGAVRCLKQGLILSAALSIILSAVAYIFRAQMLEFAGAGADTIELSMVYFECILIGTPINAVTMTISAAQRGIGETRVSMQINMLANAVSLGFNFLLIGGRLGFPALGVRGAGIATIIGWGCGFVIAVLSVANRNGFLYVFSRDISWSPDKHTLAAMFKVGSGSFVEQICMRIGFLTYTKIIADLGTMLFATHHICMNIISLSFSFGEGLGIAASSLVGQNLGAKRPDLSILYGKICQRMSFFSCTMVLILFTVAGDYLVMLFTREQAIINACRPIMFIAGLIIFGQASQMIIMGSLRGAGDTKYTAIVSLVSIMIIRPIIAWTLAYPVGLALVGAWLALMFDQYLRLGLTFQRFSSGKWMKIEL